MSFPKTINELVLPFLAIQMTEEDRLGKPYQPNGEDDSFILQASASARDGPYYDLIYGNIDNNSFGSKFSMQIRLTNGRTVTYGFHRLAQSTKWIWTMVKSNSSLEMKISSTVSSPELSNCINWAFRYFYSEVFPNAVVPWFFQEDAKDSGKFPSLKHLDLMDELEKERLQKEKEEELKAAQEARVRRSAERQRLALQEEARRLALEKQAVAKSQEIARQAIEVTRRQQDESRRLAQEKETAEKAKLAGAKDWFLRTVKSSQINPDGLLKEQLGKLSIKDTQLFSEFLDDEQIGSGLIKQWWVEYCSQPKINF